MTSSLLSRDPPNLCHGFPTAFPLSSIDESTFGNQENDRKTGKREDRQARG